MGCNSSTDAAHAAPPHRSGSASRSMSFASTPATTQAVGGCHHHHHAHCYARSLLAVNPLAAAPTSPAKTGTSFPAPAGAGAGTCCCCRCAGTHFDEALEGPTSTADASHDRCDPPRRHRSVSPKNSGRVLPQPTATDIAERIDRCIATAKRDHGITSDVAQFASPPSDTHPGTVERSAAKVRLWAVEVELPPTPACCCVKCACHVSVASERE